MMFSNLIESGSHAADLKRRGRYLLATTLFYGLLVAVTGVGSIYAYNVRLDYDPGYELVALMRFPPAHAASEQPRREQQRAAASPSRVHQVATRTELSMQTPYPERVASATTPEVNPKQAVIIANFNSNPPQASGGPVNPHNGGSPHGTGTLSGPTVPETGVTEGPPPPPTPRPSPPPRQNVGTVSLPSSVISSNVIDKPAPPYPPIAKAAGIHGAVAVQILVDEQGRVISAKATSGNPLLQSAAVQAAYRARFTPTLLSGQAVKVTGSITYNFVLR